LLVQPIYPPRQFRLNGIIKWYIITTIIQVIQSGVNRSTKSLYIKIICNLHYNYYLCSLTTLINPFNKN